MRFPDSCIIMKSDKEVHQEMTFFVLFHFTGMFFEPSSRMKKQHKKVCDRERAGGGEGKNILFMTPGRVGTSSPELGVPVSFAQISGFRGICEVSDSRAGYMPELSYGSHMFQDLVEAGIFYCALWGDDRTAAWQESLFDGLPDLFPEICPESAELFSMIRVTEPENLWYWNNEQTGETLCGFLRKGK